MTLSRRGFLKLMSASVIGTAFSGAGAWGYINEIEPDWVDVNPVALTLPRLNAAFNGYRIAQISDLHIDTGLGREGLAKAVNLINATQPDLVAITGDFITHELKPYDEYLIAELSRLTSPTVAILGNHDHWTDARAVRRILSESGIQELRNDVLTLTRGTAQFHVAGVDDVWEGLHRMDRVLEKLTAEGAALLLAHEPDYADESTLTGRFDLQISGHSHGGQINIPFLGRPALPHLGHKYPAGLYKVGGMLQYTNRGLGTVLPAVRFNCRPEITVFTLKSA